MDVVQDLNKNMGVDSMAMDNSILFYLGKESLELPQQSIYRTVPSPQRPSCATTILYPLFPIFGYLQSFLARICHTEGIRQMESASVHEYVEYSYYSNSASFIQMILL